MHPEDCLFIPYYGVFLILYVFAWLFTVKVKFLTVDLSYVCESQSMIPTWKKEDKKKLNFIQFKLIPFYDIILWSWIDTVTALVLVSSLLFCLHCPSTSWFPHQLAFSFSLNTILFDTGGRMKRTNRGERVQVLKIQIFNTLQSEPSWAGVKLNFDLSLTF